MGTCCQNCGSALGHPGRMEVPVGIESDQYPMTRMSHVSCGSVRVGITRCEVSLNVDVELRSYSRGRNCITYYIYT